MQTRKLHISTHTLQKGEPLHMHGWAKVLNEVKHGLEPLFVANVFTSSHYIAAQSWIGGPIVLRPGNNLAARRLQKMTWSCHDLDPTVKKTRHCQSEGVSKLKVWRYHMPRMCHACSFAIMLGWWLQATNSRLTSLTFISSAWRPQL